MSEKIKILYYNKDVAGVNYFRTTTPAVQLNKDHSDKFNVEINPNIPVNTQEGIDYMKQFDIIHYHRNILHNPIHMKQVVDQLKQANTTLVVDIDDYWHLDKTHPFYRLSLDQNLPQNITDNLKMADYVTTTTELFADEIRKHNPNVEVFPNAIHPDVMPQFSNNWTADSRYIRVGYSAGSSHKNDMQQLRGVGNRLYSDRAIKDQFKIILAGWDTRGETTDIKFNPKFKETLEKYGLWNNKMVKTVNASRGDVDKIPIPDTLRNAFRDQVFLRNKRAIKDEESVYLDYEKILTDDYRIIEDQDYVAYLKKIRKEPYPNESNYARRWTRRANIYAKVLDEIDINLAPLADNMFNRMKSPLKQVECWTRKLPIICSDIPPYNVDGVHMKNCMLVPVKKNAEKFWAKYIKMLIQEPNLREDLGNQLYEDFKVKYNLEHVTKNRAEFYESLVYEMNKV